MSGGRIHAGAVLLTAALIVVAGCGRRAAVRVPPTPPIPLTAGSVETGIASWYGVPYDGRPSASGEIFDKEQLTAAHRTLPFGCWVEVTDLDNGKRVNVRINDRGPFVEGRVIDLSQAAARALGMLGPGIARVELRVIAAPAFEPYAVQAGVYSDRERAEALRASLSSRFEDARVAQNAAQWRVLVGRRMTLDAANELMPRVRASAGEAIVVRDREEPLPPSAGRVTPN